MRSPIERETPMTIEPQRGRQGRSGRRIVVVLFVAFVLTAIGFALTWGAWMKPMEDSDANTGQQAVDAAAFKDEDRIPTASAPTTATGEPTNPPTGEAPNVNAPTVRREPSEPGNAR